MFPIDLLVSVALWIINHTSANGNLMYYTNILIWIYLSGKLLITRVNQNIHNIAMTNYVFSKSKAHLRCTRNWDKMFVIKSSVLTQMREKATWLLQTKAECYLREMIMFHYYKHLFLFLKPCVNVYSLWCNTNGLV